MSYLSTLTRAQARGSRVYATLFSLILKRFDPEHAHHLGAMVITAAGFPFFRTLKSSATHADAVLHVQALGLHFDSPFGVAAGFDTDATMVAGLGAL